jgi:polar amino acid transport system substrate-binding protein
MMSLKAVAAATSLIAVATLGVSHARGETTLERVQRQGYVTMGFMNEPPYDFVQDSKLTGADIAVLRHVLAKMKINEVNGVVQEFAALIPGLMAHRFDMNTAFFIRPARCKQVLFTAPIWAVLDSFIVKTGNPKNLHSYEDAAAHPEVKLGYLAAGVQKGIMQKVGLKDDQIVAFPDQPSALAAVKTGRIDAFVNSALGNQTLLDMAKDNTLERATPFKPPVIDGKPDVGFGGFSFRQDDKDFRDAFNTELVAFIGTPEHLALVRPFGFTEDDIKPAVGVTAETACGQ